MTTFYRYTYTSVAPNGYTHDSAKLFSSVEVLNAMLALWSRQGYRYFVSDEQAMANAQAERVRVFVTTQNSFRWEIAYESVYNKEPLRVVTEKNAREMADALHCDADIAATTDFRQFV